MSSPSLFSVILSAASATGVAASVIVEALITQLIVGFTIAQIISSVIGIIAGTIQALSLADAKENADQIENLKRIQQELGELEEETKDAGSKGEGRNTFNELDPFAETRKYTRGTQFNPFQESASELNPFANLQ